MGNMCTSNLDLCHYLAFVGCVILDLICTIYIFVISTYMEILCRQHLCSVQEALF